MITLKFVTFRLHTHATDPLSTNEHIQPTSYELVGQETVGASLCMEVTAKSNQRRRRRYTFSVALSRHACLYRWWRNNNIIVFVLARQHYIIGLLFIKNRYSHWASDNFERVTDIIYGVNISERKSGIEPTKKRKKRELVFFTARGSTRIVVHRLDVTRTQPQTGMQSTHHFTNG